MDAGSIRTRNGARRARRLRRGLSLLAVAAAAAFASSQAAAQEQAHAEMLGALQCTAATRLGYEVAWSSELGSFAVTGLTVAEHPADCAGRQVRVVLVDGTGAPLADGTAVLAEGATVALEGDPVDAREVEGLQVDLDR